MIVKKKIEGKNLREFFFLNMSVELRLLGEKDESWLRGDENDNTEKRRRKRRRESNAKEGGKAKSRVEFVVEKGRKLGRLVIVFF